MADRPLRLVFLPSGATAEGIPGERIDDLALRASVPLGHSCGGVGVCGKCRIRPTKGGAFLSPLSPTEERTLSPADRASGVRLACCATLRGSGAVLVLDTTEGTNEKILENLAPHTTLPWDDPRPGLGVSVDLGTTTVACCLLDLQGRKPLGLHSFLNPQIVFGDDVISRISASTAHPQGLEGLQGAIVRGLDDALREMAAQSGVSPREIREIVVAGNTVMEHLLLGVSPESIGKSPYAPAFLAHEPVRSASLGLRAPHPEAPVRLIPNVAGYVGGDIVAGTTAMEMDGELPLRLLVDIGTNNEIVLGNREALHCCATAAGPALEGARIRWGMRAQQGAVEGVRLAPEGLCLDVIGGGRPQGLCGSGLVDALALLLREGIVERSGRFVPPERCTHPQLRERLARDERGMTIFLLGDHREGVALTQKDVREVQLALGAIRTGVEVLLAERGVTREEVDEVLLAGAFGNNLHVPSAIAVGLVPDVPPEKVRSVQNTSGLGACRALASRSFYERTTRTAQRMRYIELSRLPDFQERFVRAMTF